MSARQERIARKARQRAGIEHYYKAPKVGTPRAERTTQPMSGHFNIRAFGFGPLAHRFLAQYEALGYKLMPRSRKGGK